jgi:5'-3' exonuclease
VLPGKPRVYLIDASIYIFRAWFSLPDSLSNRAGEPINAVQGFAGFLAGFLSGVQPEHVAVVFDESLTRSFRNDIYPQYKANREPAPPELKRQFGMCRELVAALGLAGYSSDRYEADDLIGTLAAGLRPRGFSIEILSTDKDLAQLVGENDVLWDYARNRRHTHADIPKLLGVRCGQVADWLALTGDAVDNIPGIPGIGAKTAAALLARFGSLEDLYGDLDAVAASGIRGAARIRRLLGEHEDTARLARELTGIAIDPEMEISVQGVQRRTVAPEDMASACHAIGLGRSMQNRLLKAMDYRATTV